MKNKLLIFSLLAGMISITSCEKEYMGPIDPVTGAPAYQTRGGENKEDQNSTGTITDSGHDSDYDTSKNKRKATTGSN